MLVGERASRPLHSTPDVDVRGYTTHVAAGVHARPPPASEAGSHAPYFAAATLLTSIVSPLSVPVTLACSPAREFISSKTDLAVV